MESYPAFIIVRIRVHPYHVEGKTLLEINARDQCRRNSKMRKVPLSNHEWNNWFRKSEWSMTIKTIMSKLDNAKVLPQSLVGILKREIYNKIFPSHYLNQLNKFSVTKIRTTWHYVFLTCIFNMKYSALFIKYSCQKCFESESGSVVSNSLWPHGLYSPWNSPGQNTGVASLSLPQGIIPTQGSNPGLPHCRWILYQLSHNGSPRILEWVAYLAYLFSRDLPDPVIEPGSPALQADSLPTELSGTLSSIMLWH